MPVFPHHRALFVLGAGLGLAGLRWTLVDDARRTASRGGARVMAELPHGGRAGELVAAPAVPEPLRFDWGPQGRALVVAEHRRDGACSSEAFELAWRALPGGERLVESF